MKTFLSLLFLFFINFAALSGATLNYDKACWQGFYLNGQLGGGWNKQDARFTNANYFNTLGSTLVGSKFDFKSSSFFGGGAVGYNHQIGCGVLGIEAGVLGTNLKKRKPSPFFPDLDDYSSKLNFIGLVKLRAGYSYKCFLPFITAGWAGGYIDMRLNDEEANITAHSKKWANGWTVGAGCDYLFTQCLFFGISYDYIEFRYKNEIIGCPNCGTGVGFGTPRVTNDAYTHAIAVRFGIRL